LVSRDEGTERLGHYERTAEQTGEPAALVVTGVVVAKSQSFLRGLEKGPFFGTAIARRYNIQYSEP
jgi:hypothetical protein